MELQKIIEMMQGASISNQCQYSLHIYTHNWLKQPELTISISESVGDKMIRGMDILGCVNESSLNDFFCDCNIQQAKLSMAIAARDKLNAEIAAMGGETLICNEVKS